MGKTNRGNEELAFLVSAIKEGRRSRRRRLQMPLALNNQRRFLNLVLPYFYYFLFQRNITVLRPVRSSRRFLQDSHILSFFLKNMTRSTPPNCLLYYPLHSYRFQIRNTAYRSGLCTSTKYISCSRSKMNAYPGGGGT